MPPITPSKDTPFVSKPRTTGSPASSPPDATPARPERSTIRPANPNKPPTQRTSRRHNSRPSGVAMTPSARANSAPPVSISPRRLRSSTSNSNKKRQRADSPDPAASAARFLQVLTSPADKPSGYNIAQTGPNSVVVVVSTTPRNSGAAKRAKTAANVATPAPETLSATSQPRLAKRVPPTQGAETGQRPGDALKNGAGPASGDDEHDHADDEGTQREERKRNTIAHRSKAKRSSNIAVAAEHSTGITNKVGNLAINTATEVPSGHAAGRSGPV